MKKFSLVIGIALILFCNLSYAAQTAIVQTDTRQEAWAKETLNNTDLQNNIDGKADVLGADDNYVTDAEKGNIVNLSGTNTGDMSDAAVKTAYENNANTNAVTDAEKGNIVNLSGTNTGDNSANTTYTIGSATQAFDAFLDDISDLIDPNADRLLFFDDSAGFLDWLIIGSGLTLTDKTLTAAAGATAWDDLGDPDAASSNNFSSHIIKLLVQDFRIGGSNETDYVKFSATGMTLYGDYTLTGTWTFADGDVTPTAFQFVYDNTIIGLDNGGLSFHDGHNVRYMLDVITLPTADGEMPVYDQDLDKWVAIVISGDITMTEAGVAAIGAEKVDSDHYVDGSIDLEHLSAGAKFYSIAVANLIDATTPSVLTVAETTNKCISNYKTSGTDHVFTMPAAHAAGNVIFQIGDEFQVDIEPDSGANFYLNGTVMANDEHIQNTADTLGERIVGYCVNINGTLTWMFYSSDAAFVEETL